MQPLLVEVTRGDVVEARHVVHAVAVRDGRVELAAGDPRLVTFLRSSAKPLQALPVVRARPDLDDEQVALLCASHRAAPEQIAVVRRILAQAPAAEAELECGPDPLAHNCSGKHAGMLALCRTKGWPLPGYRLPDHPCQRAMRDAIGEALGVDAASLPAAVDGCGVPTYAVTLEQAARAFTRIGALDGGDRVVRAMRRCTDLLRGPVAVDSTLAAVLDGWIAKGGAEGLLCAASADGLGIALKVVDGSFRAVAPATVHLLGRLGVDASELGGHVVQNSRGERVGEIRVVPV